MTATAASIALRLTPPVRYVLRIADTALIHAQRLAEWCGHGPVLEEDIALSNLALDSLGQARALLTHAATLEDHRRARRRAVCSCAGMRNAQLVESRDR